MKILNKYSTAALLFFSFLQFLIFFQEKALTFFYFIYCHNRRSFRSLFCSLFSSFRYILIGIDRERTFDQKLLVAIDEGGQCKKGLLDRLSGDCGRFYEIYAFACAPFVDLFQRYGSLQIFLIS